MKHTALFYQLSPAASAESEAQALVAVQKRAGVVQDFWRYAIPHESIRVEGFALRTAEFHRSPVYCKNSIKAWLEIHPEVVADLQPNYFHVWGKPNPDRCGEAELGGAYGYSGQQHMCRWTVEHELGHQFGYHHAGRLDPDGTHSNYGDGSVDIMASGSGYRLGLNAPHLLQAGVHTQNEILRITPPMQFLLAPAELPRFSLREGEVRHAIVPVSEGGIWRDYHLSQRATVGHPMAARGQRPDTVYVHRVERNRQTTRMMPDIHTGESRLVGDVLITHKGMDGGSVVLEAGT